MARLAYMNDSAPSPHHADDAHPSIAGKLRQMIAALESERQALAKLDADALFEATREKDALCDALVPVEPAMLDAETRPLAETAKRLNEVNRRVRNLLAANVASRLEAIGGKTRGYTATNITHA